MEAETDCINFNNMFPLTQYVQSMIVSVYHQYKTIAIFFFLSFTGSLHSLLPVEWHVSNLTSFILKCWKATGGYGLGQHRHRGILLILQRLQIVRRENAFHADAHCQLNKQRKVYIGLCKTTLISV